eukprot:1204004-Amphidinium_carterae.1
MPPCSDPELFSVDILHPSMDQGECHDDGGEIMSDLLLEGLQVTQVKRLQDGSSTSRDDARMTC